jgi:helicase
MSPLAKVMAEHFIGMERLLEILRLTNFMDDPLDVIAELESEDVHKEKKAEKGKGPGKPGQRLREPVTPKHQQRPGGRHQPNGPHQQGTQKKGRKRR